MIISEVADCTGLTIDTIRFYEKQGLLVEGLHYERTSNGYRHYCEAGLERLNLIKMGQLVGFTLNEMRQAIVGWETNLISAAEKIEHLSRKMEELDAKMGMLAQMKAYLAGKIENLRKEEAMNCHKALEQEDIIVL